MTRQRDPFERAVTRAERMHRRAALFETRSGIMRFALYLFGALGLGWTVLLAIHWVVFPQPRWLVVLHTMVLALVAGYYLIALGFIGLMKRRRPDLFGAP